MSLTGQQVAPYILIFCLLIIIAFFIFLFLKRKKKSETHASLFLKDSLGSRIKSALGSGKRLTEIVPKLEEILLSADAGVATTQKLITRLAQEKDVSTETAALESIKKAITTILTPKTEFVIDTSKKPFVIYLVGVNGVGKTTTIGKLASQFKAQGHQVLLVAADTFRAAAVEQLKIWSERNQVSFVGGAIGADPSSVIIDGLRAAASRSCDVVLVDTAGRLQTKSNLMNELKKMARMCEKELGRPPDEIFLVVDAVTGQNGFSQAKIFFEAVPLTGVILTKYDATSKGGIIIAIADETKLPIRYVGLGEKIEDLKKFEADEFVTRLFS